MRQATMTVEQARSFERTSISNYAMVRAQLKCSCNPYEDCYTYNRWLAQGYQVMRGQHGIKLPLIKQVEVEDKETGEITTKRLLAGSTVFCRCQVKSINGHETEPKKAPVVIIPEPVKVEPKAQTQAPVDNIMKGWRIL